VKAALHILAAVSILLLPAGCKRAPASWGEWLDQATAEYNAKQYAKMLESCDRALQIARSDNNGPRVINAYECLAEAAARVNQPERTFEPFRKILSLHDKDLRESGAALRLRNNFGVALVNAGEKREGVDMLESTIDAYEGTPQHSSGYYRIRMLLVENLARAARVFTEEDSGIKVSSVMLEEILVHIENERFRNNLPFTLGTGDALAAIAELVRIRGDPKYALELAAQAKEQQDIEDAVLEGKPRKPPCEQVIIRSLVMAPCYTFLK
jgi:tetratricopeptide (TPR) repeat protein